MYKRRDKEFVIDMFIAVQNIMEYTEAMDFEKFFKDKKTVDAVLRNIEILGEAVKNISKEFQMKYPEIEWNAIAKTRDKLIHFYFGKVGKKKFEKNLSQFLHSLKSFSFKEEPGRGRGIVLSEKR